MKNYLKTNKYIILTIVLLCSLMFFFINQKHGFHEDEIFSYGSSNYKYDNVFRWFGYAEAGQDILYQQVLTGSVKDRIIKLKTFLLEPDKFTKDEVLAQEIPTWRTKDDALEYLAIQKEDIFNYFSVYYNQAKDVHPPLFYFLVHFISTLFYGSFSKYIIFFIRIHRNIFNILNIFIGNIYKFFRIIEKFLFYLKSADSGCLFLNLSCCN